MNRSNAKSIRILAIAPSTRGFGFAVSEGETLVNWGVKSVKGDKNTQCLLKIEEMLVHYLPGVMSPPGIAGAGQGTDGSTTQDF
jgi:hypothetical protein